MRAAWDVTALRAGSVAAREVVARQASGLVLGLDSVLALAMEVASATPRPDAIDAWRRLQPEHLIRLARMLAVQRIEAGDMRQALDIYRGILRAGERGTLPRRHLMLATELAIFLQEYRLADEILHRLSWKSDEYLHLRCDLANPFTRAPGANEEAWLSLLGRFFIQSGVEAVQLAPADPDLIPFDRLEAPLEPRSVRGPLVSIVMSSWCPDQSLEVAVDSLLRQTWADLEILLIDDASPSSYWPLLEKVAAKDDRIRLIRQDVNQGTYVARNKGLAEASGEFFTVQDSDDWAHPARIERQVLHLLEDARLLADHCKGIRTSEYLEFNLPGVAPMRTNESSLLFRTAPVRERIGFYDASRKGADTEYSLRLRRSFGEHAYDILPGVLTAIRLSRGSLSRAEFKPGWRHPARAAYRRGFEAWHHMKQPGEAGLYLGDGHFQARKFQLPRRFRIEQGDGRRTYDYLLVGDLATGSYMSRILYEEMMLLAREGVRVGIMHLTNFERPAIHSVDSFWPPIRRAIDKGVVEEVMSSDSAATRRLLVMDPALLQFAAKGRAQLAAAEAFIIAPSGTESGDGRPAFNPRICEEWVHVMFGCQASWVARDDRARDWLRSAIPARQLARACWPIAIDRPSWRAPRRLPKPSTGTIRFALELDCRRSVAEQFALYARLTSIPARIWLETCAGSGEGVPLPGHWIAAPMRSEKATLMATTDVWLHLEPATSGILPRGVCQAMAAGCLLVMHDSWRELAGICALYLDDDADRPTLERLLADRASVDAAVIAASGMPESVSSRKFTEQIDRIAVNFER
jgi:glycosyltransferase involved in cell wall biosynthesis